MTRKLIRTFAIAALFSGLTTSTAVLAEQSRHTDERIREWREW
jgi:hypothetical protein